MDCKLVFVTVLGLFLTSQLICGQSDSTRRQALPPHWGPWSLWSSCTNKTEVGARVRSRICVGGSCLHLPGENYELQLCSQKNMGIRVQKKNFIDKCKYNPKMNSTLSCKLYLENPAMAYNIFKSTDCLFDSMIGQDSPPSETRSSNRTLLQRLSNSNTHETSSRSSGENEQYVFVNGTLMNFTQNPFFFTRRGKEKSLHQFCRRACNRIVLRAPITSPSSSIPNLAQQHQDNGVIHRGNNAARSFDYSICLRNCRDSRGDYNALEMNWRNGGRDSSEQVPKLCVNLKENAEEDFDDLLEDDDIEEEVVHRKRRETSSNSEHVRQPYILSVKETTQIMEDALYAKRPGVSRKISRRDQILYGKKLSSSPAPALFHHVAAILQEEGRSGAAGKRRRTHKPVKNVHRSTAHSSKGNVSLSRNKRQLAPAVNASRYKSPCYETTEYSTTPRVLNLDSTVGELFFYEGRQQRFLRRRCAGTAVVPGSLFRPRESVTQTRTGRLALCKQGFLKRYGLLIQLDPMGVFAFNNGERFSVKFKPFKLESHCALSTFE